MMGDVRVLLLTGLSLGLLLLVSCGPNDAHRRSTAGSRARSRPARKAVPAAEAAALATRFRRRAQGCFPAVFSASFGTPPSALDRGDGARWERALQALERELRFCLTGQGYGGQAMIAARTVRGWLVRAGCDAFASTAFRSRECFALQGVLDGVGFPRRPPRVRPRAARLAPRRLCAHPEPPDSQGRVAAAHILVFFAGASRAPARITRTRAQALALATRIAGLARKPGADFAALARTYSEGPTARRGGRLGAFLPSRMVPPFSRALLRLCIGQVSDPVLTRFGYHVILRQRP